MKNRILIYSSQYLPLIGGMERQMQFIGKSLVAQGWDVNILTPRRQRDSAKKEYVDGMLVFRCMTSFIPRTQSIVEAFGAIFFLLKNLFVRYTVIHCHCYNIAAFFCVLFAFIKRAEAVVTFHSYPQVPRTGTLQWCLFQILKRKIKVVAVSSEVAEMMLQQFPGFQNLKVIRNGVDIAQFYPAGPAEVSMARKTLGLPGDKKIIMYVGRLSPEKGIDVLNKAAKYIIEETEAVIVLAGCGPEEGECRILAKRYPERYILLGMQDNPFLCYHAADIYILPSFREGTPVALLEAMASGNACIATNTEGSASVIQNGSDGVLVSVGDSKEIAAAVSRLLNDPGLICELGNNARRDVVSAWSGAAQISSTIDFYNLKIN